jgi:hypothetical protein
VSKVSLNLNRYGNDRSEECLSALNYFKARNIDISFNSKSNIPRKIIAHYSYG